MVERFPIFSIRKYWFLFVFQLLRIMIGYFCHLNQETSILGICFKVMFIFKGCQKKTSHTCYWKSQHIDIRKLKENYFGFLRIMTDYKMDILTCTNCQIFMKTTWKSIKVILALIPKNVLCPKISLFVQIGIFY